MNVGRRRDVIDEIRQHGLVEAERGQQNRPVNDLVFGVEFRPGGHVDTDFPLYNGWIYVGEFAFGVVAVLNNGQTQNSDKCPYVVFVGFAMSRIFGIEPEFGNADVGAAFLYENAAGRVFPWVAENVDGYRRGQTISVHPADA